MNIKGTKMENSNDSPGLDIAWGACASGAKAVLTGENKDDAKTSWRLPRWDEEWSWRDIMDHRPDLLPYEIRMAVVARKIRGLDGDDTWSFLESAEDVYCFWLHADRPELRNTWHVQCFFAKFISQLRTFTAPVGQMGRKRSLDLWYDEVHELAHALSCIDCRHPFAISLAHYNKAFMEMGCRPDEDGFEDHIVECAQDFDRLRAIGTFDGNRRGGYASDIEAAALISALGQKIASTCRWEIGILDVPSEAIGFLLARGGDRPSALMVIREAERLWHSLDDPVFEDECVVEQFICFFAMSMLDADPSPAGAAAARRRALSQSDILREFARCLHRPKTPFCRELQHYDPGTCPPVQCDDLAWDYVLNQACTFEYGIQPDWRG